MRYSLGDVERTLLNFSNRNYLVYQADAQGFRRAEDLSCDGQSERTPLAYGRRNRVEDHEGPEAMADSGESERRVFGGDRHMAVGHQTRPASLRDTVHSANQRLR